MRGAADIFEGDLGDLINFGTIAEVDLERGRVRVAAGEVESDWIRWGMGRAGATRSWSPPSVGEQIIFVAPGGDIAQAAVIGSIPSNAHPPAGNSLRELIQFQDGAVVAYDPEAHALEAILPAGATINIVAPGGITVLAEAGVTIDVGDGGLTVKGDVTIEGDVDLTGELRADVDVQAGTISLKEHLHSGVGAGTAKTGLPE